MPAALFAHLDLRPHRQSPPAILARHAAIHLRLRTHPPPHRRDHLLGDYNQNGPGAGGANGMREFIWIDDLPIAVLRHPGSPQANAISEVSFITADHLNTPRALIRPKISNAETTQTYSGGVAVWLWSPHSGAFGEGQTEEDPDADKPTYNFPLRFPGQFRDAKCGVFFNYFRDYEAGTGRYLQSDPIGLTSGTATYLYAGAHVKCGLDNGK